MATYRVRNGRVTAEIRRQGVYTSKTFATQAQAKRWVKRIESTLPSSKSKPVTNTLHHVLLRYREEVSVHKRGVIWENGKISYFIKTLKYIDKNISEITSEDISSWMKSRKIKSNSIRRDLTLLNSVFNMAIKKWNLLDINPIDSVVKPPLPNPRKQDISPAQIERLFTTAKYVHGQRPTTRFQLVCAAFELATLTAMRAGEIISLNKNTIFIDKKYVVLPLTKNGSARTVPLPKKAVEILNSLNENKPFNLKREYLSGSFIRLITKAGMKGQFTFHDSRAFAIKQLSKKLDVYELARMTGHKDINQLLIYYRKSATEIADILDIN